MTTLPPSGTSPLDAYSPERLNAIYNGPVAAAIYVALRSGTWFNVMFEIATAGRFVEKAKVEPTAEYGPLVQALLAYDKTATPAGKEAVAFHVATPTTTRNATADANYAALLEQSLALVKRAANAVRGRAGADGYRRWVLAVAEHAALVRSGGFLGIIGGAAEIDPRERAALDEIGAFFD
jgi:hypothetical protein